ncbi:hypothetical protein J7K74_03835 [Candidatus Woesearchaeota archaeon]|nr:hypothetical protein [Candidatus Woesearchaeota archaeon]
MEQKEEVNKLFELIIGNLRFVADRMESHWESIKDGSSLEPIITDIFSLAAVVATVLIKIGELLRILQTET